MASVSIKNVTKIYDDQLKKPKKKRRLIPFREKVSVLEESDGPKKAVENLSIEIPDGSFTVIVGPSGCGKSTLLRMIAGLEDVTEGDIYIGGNRVNDVKPGDRGISMVFQNYAIYPTMTVRENITFGLENNKVPKDEIEKRLKAVAETVELTEYLDRMPDRLSGGQRQRIALARAIVKRPEIYVFDEPLSNLDAKLRGDMRSQLIDLHNNLETTFIYVTHDQVEAMTMADQIILLEAGRLVQAGSPMDLYHDPNSRTCAEFLGSPGMNVLDIKVANNKYGKGLEVGESFGYRPSRGKLTSLDENIEGRVSIPSKIMTRELLGSETLYKIENEYGTQSVKEEFPSFVAGDEVNLNLDMDDIYYFDKEGDRIYEA